jgi:hypothetical protein
LLLRRQRLLLLRVREWHGGCCYKCFHNILLVLLVVAAADRHTLFVVAVLICINKNSIIINVVARSLRDDV